MRPRDLLLLPPLLATLACQAEPGLRVRLADYPFDRLQDHPFHLQIPDAPPGVHVFESGWGKLEPKGRWTVGPEAAAHFYVLGDSLELDLRWATDPRLSEMGQTVELHWNDHPVSVDTLTAGWAVDSVTVHLAKPLVQPGWNTLRLRPRVTLPPRGTETRPLGVFVQALRISAVQTSREQRRWRELHAVDPPDPAWAFGPIGPSDRPPPEQLPDILLLIMDTARADHYSSYGYPRPTTPEVDRLAETGIRLTNVLAEAPYTRASVHGVLTGASWRDHRMLDHGDQLPPQWVTLPEILAAAGYQTLAFFDNAQVCEASGATQGFQEWVEAWKDPRRRGWMPEMPERLFRERVQKGLDDRPAFVFVHTMPPHNPYLPGDDHDLFGPPGYDGPIRGRNKDIFAFDDGLHPPNGPDYQRLVALYDGSLHRGDAMIGRIVRTWHDLERPRETVVVVISDHGEAFGEHGRFSHNTTLYDEMLAVPVVLHPATRFAALRGSEDRFRSLVDLTPILLHSIGLRPAAGTQWPSHFLRVLESPRTPRPEVFVRTAGGTCGLRTPTRLVFYRPAGEAALYDLTRDPSASANLWQERPEEYLSLVRRIRSFLADTQTGDAARAPLRPEDEERLRALGYL